MRTVEEIKERINKKKQWDLFGTIVDLIEFLPPEHAKPFLKEDANVEDFVKEYTKENVIKEIKNYLPFAYDKAEGARGLSSGRSIMHFCHWLWLLEDHELLAFVEDDDNYPMYGFPMLQKIAEKYYPELKRDYDNIEDKTGARIHVR